MKIMEMILVIKQEAIEKLTQPSSEAALDDFIEWLDLNHYKAWEIREASIISFIQLLLMVSVIAIGEELLKKENSATKIRKNVEATVVAAQRFLAQPTDDNFDNYFEKATNSFPFGAGDGCLSINYKKKGCKPGSGCSSGAGTLKYGGLQRITPTEAYEILQNKVLNWLSTFSNENDLGELIKY